jgi:3-dehydroquinate synthase II/3-amino-4-hydroxybenzoic acid synthase
MKAELWVDVTALSLAQTPAALAMVRSSAASAVLARPEQLTDWEPIDRITTACLVGTPAGPGPDEARLNETRADVIVVDSPSALRRVRDSGAHAVIGIRCEIVDGASMDAAADMCGIADVLIAAFADETNIPLELLIAKAQHTGTRVLKELDRAGEASTVLGVLECGPAGLVVRGDQLAGLQTVAGVLSAQRDATSELTVFEVSHAEPAGMGYRGCIDTTTLFDDDEGMIVGSTSSGGILVCAEVHYLPYMDLRPFRVNAGAVHSYVFGSENTAYVTDLQAGRRTCGVSASGRFREVVVGRVKVELRPLRLIVAHHGDVTVNVMLQDDWHVRVMSAERKPLNLTEVRPGTQLLGYACTPGRHVGIQVAERIREF